MIWIDGREGSVEMSHLIEESVVVTLDYGDAAFLGKGPDGEVEVGVERKKIGDLLNSIATGRLGGHQLPGLLSSYHKVYLIVEGEWRANPITGIVEAPRRKGMWVDISKGRKFRGDEVWAFLTTMENTGVIVRTTRNMTETCRMIENLERWWNKEWDKHRSHLAMHKRPMGMAAVLTTSPPSLLRRIAAELPHIGVDRSRLVERHFRSVVHMINAEEEEWMEVEGVGKVTAREVVEAVRKGEEENERL